MEDALDFCDNLDELEITNKRGETKPLEDNSKRRILNSVKSLYSFAYNLVNLFRLQLPSSMRSAQIETLRMQLFKIGARIRQTARCIRVHLASGWPYQDLFQAASLCNSS